MDINSISIGELNIREIGVWPLAYRCIGVVAFGLLLFFILYNLILKSNYNQLKFTDQQIQNSLNNFREAFQQSANLETYSKQMVEIQNLFNDLLKKLPTKGELPLLLEDISQQALSAGLTFDLIKPEQPIDKGFYFEQPIKIVLKGKYHGFGNFAAGIAALPRIITVHDFSIKRNLESNKQQSGDTVLTIETQATTYWYVDKEQL